MDNTKVYTYCKLFIISFLIFSSCIYKAGNRQPDLNFSLPISINTYYVDNYMREKWMKPIYESPVNSELVNYPRDFVPLTDSSNGLKYVIELGVSADSFRNNGWGLSLNSIYDFNKEQWITNRDSLKNGELEKFTLFFKDSILIKVVQQYKGKLPDSLLFISDTKDIEIKSLK